MTCERFAQLLQAYARGELGEPEFGDCVEHEAICASCRDSALEAWSEVAAPAAVHEGVPSDSLADPTLLARTVGSDCLYVELRIAEALDDEPSNVVVRQIRQHLDGCASCRRMREILSELPDWYALYPQLTADRAFARDVLDRTIGPQPGFIDVVRALWRRPEAIFEAAVACALVTALLFGHAHPPYLEIKGQAEQAVTEQIQKIAPERAEVHGLRDALVQTSTSVSYLLGPRDGYLRRQAVRAYDGTVKVSAWMERAGSDLRTGDYQALMREIQGALRSFGINLNAKKSPDRDGENPGGSPEESKN